MKFTLTALLCLVLSACLLIGSVHCDKSNKKDKDKNAKGKKPKSSSDNKIQNKLVTPKDKKPDQTKSKDTKEKITSKVNLQVEDTKSNSSQHFRNVGRRDSINSTLVTPVNTSQDEVESKRTIHRTPLIPQHVDSRCDSAQPSLDQLKNELRSLRSYVYGIHQPIHVHVYNGQEMHETLHRHEEHEVNKKTEQEPFRKKPNSKLKKNHYQDNVRNHSHSHGSHKHIHYQHHHSKHNRSHNHTHHHNHSKHHRSHNHTHYHHDHSKHHRSHNHTHYYDHSKHHGSHNHTHYHDHSKHHRSHNHTHYHDHSKYHRSHNHTHFHDHSKHHERHNQTQYHHDYSKHHGSHNYTHYHHDHSKPHRFHHKFSHYSDKHLSHGDSKRLYNESHYHNKFYHHHHGHHQYHHGHRYHQDKDHHHRYHHVPEHQHRSKHEDFNIHATHIHLHIQVTDKGSKPVYEEQHRKVEEKPKDIPVYARCDMKPYNSKHNISGTVWLSQQPGDDLKVQVKLQGFFIYQSLNNSTVAEEVVTQLHGFHVHEFGDISQGCASMGGHFNPEGVDHGFRNHNPHGHIGDWGNIEVDRNGHSLVNLTFKAASLLGENSIVGRGIVVHAQRDDLGKGHAPDSKTTGDAGGRIACCSIVRTKSSI